MTKNTISGKIKKLAASILAVVTLTTTMCATAFAATPIVPLNVETAGMTRLEATSHSFTVKAIKKTLIVKSDGVNIRTNPWVGSGSSVIGAAGHGQKLNITGQVYKNGNMADWYRISWNGRTAYVSKSFSGAEATNTTPKKQTQPQKNVTGYKTVTGVTNYLGVRSAKSTDSRYEIGRMYNGERCKVINSSDSQYWLVKSTATGVQGYVLARFLK